MIELIFVIVIIGILAAVAIPKLAATRDDAKISAELASVRQGIDNLGSEFTSQGSFGSESVAAASDATKCFTITSTDDQAAEGNITVTLVSATTDGTCDSVVNTQVGDEAAKIGIIKADKAAKDYSYGGVSVKR